MTDEKFVRLRVHRNNIDRYRQLLKTTLTDIERDFIELRLSEEQAAIDALFLLKVRASSSKSESEGILREARS